MSLAGGGDGGGTCFEGARGALALLGPRTFGIILVLLLLAGEIK